MSQIEIASSRRGAERTDAPVNMVWIPGGTFRMGSDRHYPEEAPVHGVTVGGFWMDRTPVTNRAFRKFVNATGYVTFAEIKPEAKDYPGALPEMLKAGSLVFTPPKHAVDPESIDGHAMHRRFFGIVIVGAHAKRAARDPEHVGGWRAGVATQLGQGLDHFHETTLLANVTCRHCPSPAGTLLSTWGKCDPYI